MHLLEAADRDACVLDRAHGTGQSLVPGVVAGPLPRLVGVAGAEQVEGADGDRVDGLALAVGHVRGGAVVGKVGQVAAEQVGDVAGDVLPLGVGVGVAGALHGLRGLGEGHALPAGDVEQAGVPGVLGLAEERAGGEYRGGDLGSAPPPGGRTLLEQAEGVTVAAVEVDQLGLLDGRGDRDLQAAAGNLEVAGDLGDGDRVAGLLGGQGRVAGGEPQLHQLGEHVA